MSGNEARARVSAGRPVQRSDGDPRSQPTVRTVAKAATATGRERTGRPALATSAPQGEVTTELKTAVDSWPVLCDVTARPSSSAPDRFGRERSSPVSASS